MELVLHLLNEETLAALTEGSSGDNFIVQLQVLAHAYIDQHFQNHQGEKPWRPDPIGNMNIACQSILVIYIFVLT